VSADGEFNWSTVYDNEKAHDYDIVHTFGRGFASIHSTTFSDFEFFAGIDNSVADFGFRESWNDISNYSVKGGWGSDVYMSDCGFAFVEVKENTRPTINDVTVNTRTVRMRRNGGGPLMRYSSFSPDVFDEHTESENLTYVWEIKGFTRYTREATIARPASYSGVSAPFKLTVSDGVYSSIYTGTFEY
jgi:hypothetical protein